MFIKNIVLSTLLAALVLTATSCAHKQPQVADGAQTVDPISENQSEVQLDPALTDEPSQDTSSLSSKEINILKSRAGLDFDLDLHDSEEVRRYFTFYTHKARKTFTRWLKRSEEYLPHVRRELIKHGLPQDIALLPFGESGYNVYAYSRAGAAGMWQFMPGTARKYGLTVNWWIDERRDPILSTEAAARYLKELYGIFNDWHLALAAYNAGEGKIGRALKATNTNNFFELHKKNHTIKSRRSRLRKETLNYVPKFIAISKIFQNLEELGFEPVNWLNSAELAHAEVAGGTDLAALAKAAGMTWEEFRMLNPSFRRQISPPDDNSTVHFPRKSVAAVMEHLSHPDSHPYSGFIRHTVKSGDNWWQLSRRYGVPVAELKSLNNRSSNLLKPGQSLLVPGRNSVKPAYSAKTTKTAKAKTSMTVASSATSHSVRRGDTLWSISRAYKVDLENLRQANSLHGNAITVGQRLVIPAKNTQVAMAGSNGAEQIYKVRRGDNLTNIARRFGVSTNTLLRWNDGLGSKSLIHPGDKLKVYVQ